ncbi:MAG: hypothetical protein EBV06_17750 [Planctomycetia bacterium]|nr:hypothetical protein [Planctomycetia bacterium]
MSYKRYKNAPTDLVRGTPAYKMNVQGVDVDTKNPETIANATKMRSVDTTRLPRAGLETEA